MYIVLSRCTLAMLVTQFLLGRETLALCRCITGRTCRETDLNLNFIGEREVFLILRKMKIKAEAKTEEEKRGSGRGREKERG